VTEPRLGINWLRANRIIWDFAKNLLIVNGEVFDMILVKKSQELKRRRWLEERNDKDDIKRVKIEKTGEMKVINRIRAVTLDCEVNRNRCGCVFSAPVNDAVRPNDIQYPCFLCGPATTGFSRARDLMRHLVCSQDLFPARVEQGKHYECNGLDLVTPMPEQYEKYSDGSHRGKKKLGEKEKLENEGK